MTSPLAAFVIVVVMPLVVIWYAYYRFLPTNLKPLSWISGVVTLNGLMALSSTVRAKDAAGMIMVALWVGGLVWLLRHPSKWPVALLLGLQILFLADLSLNRPGMEGLPYTAAHAYVTFGIYHTCRSFQVVLTINQQSFATEAGSKEPQNRQNSL